MFYLAFFSEHLWQLNKLSENLFSLSLSVLEWYIGVKENLECLPWYCCYFFSFYKLLDISMRSCCRVKNLFIVTTIESWDKLFGACVLGKKKLLTHAFVVCIQKQLRNEQKFIWRMCILIESFLNNVCQTVRIEFVLTPRV